MKYTTQNIFTHPLNENNDVQEALTDFVKMRKTMRKPCTERAVKLLMLTLVELSGGDADLAVKVIDQSIKYSYLDFYQLKQESNFTFDQPKRREEL